MASRSWRPGACAKIAVTRASRIITVKDIEERIAAALAAQPGVGAAKDLTVTIERDARPLQLEPTRRASCRRRASTTIRAPAASTSRSSCPAAPSRAACRCAMSAPRSRPSRSRSLARPLGRGEVVRASDRRDRAPPEGGPPRRRRQVDRRCRRARGAPAAARRRAAARSDLMKPELVQTQRGRHADLRGARA